MPVPRDSNPVQIGQSVESKFTVQNDSARNTDNQSLSVNNASILPSSSPQKIDEVEEDLKKNVISLKKEEQQQAGTDEVAPPGSGTQDEKLANGKEGEQSSIKVPLVADEQPNNELVDEGHPQEEPEEIEKNIGSNQPKKGSVVPDLEEDYEGLFFFFFFGWVTISFDALHSIV